MWRPRDHERFIGGYDPEHEMPDPDRRPRGRYESDAYRYNARDSRYPYRWNPDRFEERFRDRDDRREWELRWNRDARDRDFGRDYGRDYYDGRYAYDRDRGFDRGYDRYDFDRGWNDRNGGYYGSDYDRGYDRDRGYNRDREWPRDRERWSGIDYDDEDRWRNRRW